jgi:hypothetical protein
MREQINVCGGTVRKMDPKHRAAELRKEIVERLSQGEDWLHTGHPLLGGLTPDQAIESGDIEAVRNLLGSILYIGIS